MGTQSLPEGIVEYIGGYPVHPVASFFPLMGGDDFDKLTEDIRDNGLRDPIVVAEYWPNPYEVIRAHGEHVEDGEHIEGVDFGPEINEALATPNLVLVDGRNRLRACEVAGVEPSFTTNIPGITSEFVQSGSVEWEESITRWVSSHNLTRRHMDGTDKVRVGVRLRDHLAELAKQRQGARNDLQEHSRQLARMLDVPDKDNDKKSAVEAAKLSGASARQIERAVYVEKNDPELAEKMWNKQVSISKAEKVIRERETPAPTPEEVQAAREAMLQKEAARILRNYSSEEITLLLHYIHEGKNADA